MKVIPLSIAEMAAYQGANLKVELTWADFTDDDAAQTLSPINMPAKSAIYLTQFRLITPFVLAAATGETALTITVGDGGSATRFLGSTELLGAQTEINNATGALTGIYAYDTADTVDVFVGAAGGDADVNNCNVGECHLYFFYVPPPGTTP